MLSILGNVLWRISHRDVSLTKLTSHSHVTSLSLSTWARSERDKNDLLLAILTFRNRPDKIKYLKFCNRSFPLKKKKNYCMVKMT